MTLDQDARTPPGSLGRQDGESGMALLAVLWIVSSAVILVASFNMTARSGASFIMSEIQLSKFDAALDAGLEIAVTRLSDVNEKRRWTADAVRRTVMFSGIDIGITVVNPNSFIDLNKSDREVLMGLFSRYAGSKDRATRICESILRARNASTGVARDKPLGTDATDHDNETDRDKPAAFIDVSQLRQMDGMTLDLYRAVSPYMTVYSSDGLINPETAPTEVLAAIPDMTGSAMEFYRSTSSTRSKNMIARILEYAEAYVTDQQGPTYLVYIDAGDRRTYRARKSFAITLGLDEAAPYRLISTKHEISAN